VASSQVVAGLTRLAPFYLAHRDDGHGRPACDPKTLLIVLLYAYCLGMVLATVAAIAGGIALAGLGAALAAIVLGGRPAR
jgi:hypothetical protein